MLAGLKDTPSVPERWKIWAMSTMLAPASRVASALGTQAMAKSTSPLASCTCGVTVGRVLDQRHVQALVLEVALVLRRVVAGELRLGHPLQLQLDGIGRVAEIGAALPPDVVSAPPSVVSVPPSVVAVVSSLAAVVVAAAPAVVADAAVVALPLSSSSPQAATISVKTASPAAIVVARRLGLVLMWLLMWFLPRGWRPSGVW